MPVRTVDGESLSNIAIHNFEKSPKIEIRIVPYGEKNNLYLGSTLFPLQWSQ